MSKVVAFHTDDILGTNLNHFWKPWWWKWREERRLWAMCQGSWMKMLLLKLSGLMPSAFWMCFFGAC